MTEQDTLKARTKTQNKTYPFSLPKFTQKVHLTCKKQPKEKTWVTQNICVSVQKFCVPFFIAALYQKYRNKHFISKIEVFEAKYLVTRAE